MENTLTLGDITARRSAAINAKLFLARAIARYLGDNDPDSTAFEFEKRGGGALLRKDGAHPLLSEDVGSDSPLHAAFVADTGRRSILGRLAGVVKVPVASHARLQVIEVEGSTPDEAVPTTVGKLLFDVSGLQPQRHEAIIVVTSEAVKSVDGATLDALYQLIADAAARAADRWLVSQWTTGSPVSAAPTLIGTVAKLVGAISGGEPRRAHIVGSPERLIPLAADLDGLIRLGVSVVPSASVGANVIAVDAAAIAVKDAGAELRLGQHGDVRYSDGGSPEELLTARLFQDGLIAVRATRYLGMGFRPGAVAHAVIA